METSRRSAGLSPARDLDRRRLHLLLLQPVVRPALIFYQTDVRFDQQFIGHLGAVASIRGRQASPSPLSGGCLRRLINLSIRRA
jgi:hypothetical protein